MPHSLNYVDWKQRKEVAADLKLIYAAAMEAEAETRLAEFGANEMRGLRRSPSPGGRIGPG